ncbi:MAG: SufD family Fe-S cluster assembly protein, partial [Nostoc sp.]|uniref:SufD family Fe-S cluster assembly protein n=1 Tax=Nostoc sp. TaxID=1180 RepID=UPI002FF73FAF
MSIQISPSPIPNSNVVSLTSTLLDKDTYLTELLNQVTAPKTEGWLQELREGAANWVRHSTIPTTREEEWRFTDLSSLRKVQFHVETGNFASLQFDILPEAANSRLVFVNGVFAPELSAVSDLPSGIVVSNLAGLSEVEQQAVQQYLAQAEGAQEVFTALNTAGITDAAVVWVKKNVVVETPIHLVFISVAGENATISQPRCLVVAESGSQVTLVEEYANRRGAEEGVYLTNAVTEIWVGDNAEVNHTRVEQEGAEAFHIGKTAIAQARDSRYTCHAITLGAK